MKTFFRRQPSKRFLHTVLDIVHTMPSSTSYRAQVRVTMTLLTITTRTSQLLHLICEAGPGSLGHGRLRVNALIPEAPSEQQGMFRKQDFISYVHPYTSFTIRLYVPGRAFDL